MTTRAPLSFQQASDYKDAYWDSAYFYFLALRKFVLTAPDTPKNRIVENFVAAAITRMGSIFLLWEEGNYTDCWILHRALLDRYMHLRRLVREDEFGEFERWSTQRQFKDAESLLTDPDFFSESSPEKLKDFQELLKEGRSRMNREPKSNWKRPKAQDELTNDELRAELRAAYNFGSMKVHPMHNDGEADFARLFLSEKADETKEIPVLHGSFVIFHLIIVEWLGASNVSWKRFVMLFGAEVRDFLASGSKEYKDILKFALELDPDVDWCSEHFPEEEGSLVSTKTS